MKFHGTLNINNLEEVANMIYEMLQDKVYTFVSANEYFRFKPEVRTNQQMKPGTNGSPLSIYFDEKNDTPQFCGFHIGDTYGVWGCSTSRQEPGYDPDFNDPYVVLEWSQIVITHRAPAGHLLYWVIAIQDKS